MAYKKEDHEKKIMTYDPNNSNKIGSLKERLISLKRGRSNRETATAWDIPLSTLTGYINRGSMLPADTALSIAEKENISAQWLVNGQETTSNTRQSASIEVPKYNVAASAGGGTYIEKGSIEDYYPFSLEYLRRLRISNADLIIVEAHGDSMEPYIESGDDLLLKRIEFNPDNLLSGIHVISIDGMLKVKRLQYSLQRNGYRIISDNSEYPEELIGQEELMQGRMRVIGEVVMVMGRPSQPVAKDRVNEPVRRCTYIQPDGLCLMTGQSDFKCPIYQNGECGLYDKEDQRELTHETR